MKKIANAILEDNQEENVVFMTEDGQGFFDLTKATNHADNNEFDPPEAFYRAGCEPDDTKALAEQLEFAMEENETLSEVISKIEQAVDFTQDAPEVNQETNEVVASVVQLREKQEGAIALIDKVLVALSVDEVVVDQQAEPIIVAIMKLRASLNTTQSELATLKANALEVVQEKEVEPVVKAAKNGK